MMGLRRHLAPLLWTVALGTVSFVVHAQNTDSGTVTGHVFCADTQKPARFASIRLQPVDGQAGRGGRGGFATTGSDGSFRITGVPPGDYYADVTMPGYIQPLRALMRDPQDLSTTDRDRLTAQLTRVNVANNQSATAQVTIYRGATVSGMITFDDGAPAPGIGVQAYALSQGSTTGGQGNGPLQSFAAFAQSDDRGQYRLTGLSDGTYVIFASPRSLFPIYYGNTIEKNDAKKLEVHAGDEVPGTDIQIPAGGMHRVSGVVVSQQDGHPLARASIQLRLSSGDSNAIGATTGSDGTFNFSAVPDGKFTVQVSNAYDANGRTGYSSTGQALEVNGTDVTDLVVNAAAHN